MLPMIFYHLILPGITTNFPNMKQLPQRFWDQVHKQESCWIWNGQKGRVFGYGQIKLDGRVQRTHRVMWESINGPIPDGMCVCHKCDVQRCVNPDHLWLGTRADNNADKLAKGRGNMPHGRYHHRAKLTEDNVRAIKAALARNQTKKSIARQYGVSSATIRGIVRGDTWKHVLD